MPETNQISLLDTDYQRPRLRRKPSSFRVDTNRGRKPIDITADATDADIQKIATERQQVITRFTGYNNGKKNITEFTPTPPPATLLYIENKDGEKTLLNSITDPSPDFITKCENYADSHKLDLTVHYPDGYSRYIPALTPEMRASFRETPPTMSKCRRCGSITCGTGMTNASPRCKPQNS